MASPVQTQFARIKRLPPYVFNITDELKMAARRRGEDIIDFGMGNPDGPTPQHIVDKLVEAAQRPDTHGYSVSQGHPAPAPRDLQLVPARATASSSTRTREAIVTIGSKEGLAHLMLATLGPRRHRAGAESRATRSTSTAPVIAGADIRSGAHDAGRGFLRRAGARDQRARSRSRRC